MKRIIALFYLMVDFLDNIGIIKLPFYRILTENELIEKYGYSWPYIMPGGFSMDMLYLLGKRIPIKLVRELKNINKDQSLAPSQRLYRATFFTKDTPVGCIASFLFHYDIIKIDKDRKEYSEEFAGFITYPGNEEANRDWQKIVQKYSEWKQKKRKYRFKTEQEFYDEYGPDFNDKIEFGWSMEMTVLYGLPVHTLEAAHLYFARAKRPKTVIKSIPYPDLIQKKFETEESDSQIASRRNCLRILDESCVIIANYHSQTQPFSSSSKNVISRSLCSDAEHNHRVITATGFHSFSGCMIISTENETEPQETKERIISKKQ